MVIMILMIAVLPTHPLLYKNSPAVNPTPYMSDQPYWSLCK